MVAALDFESSGELRVALDDNGIMQVEYPPHTRVSFAKIQEEYYKRLDITKEKTPLLVQLHGMVFFELRAREFLCSERNSTITSAAAVVLDPKAGYQGQSNIFMEMFKQFGKPPFPVEVFENKDAAVEWLKKYL